MIVPSDRAHDPISFDVIRLPDRRTTYTADVLQIDERQIVLSHCVVPSRPLTVGGEVVIDSGYRAVWFLVKDQPWDVGRFYRPDGTFTGYYVDVLEPVQWDGADPTSLRPLVDLFLDLRIAPDGTCQVLDEDEFEEAVRSEFISSEQQAHARNVLSDLVERFHRGVFPPTEVRDFCL